MKLLTLIFTISLIAACSSDKASQNLYSTSEVGHAKRTLRCTVLSARDIIIRDNNAGSKGEGIGFFTGSILSSRNNDGPLAGIIGGIVGGAAGRAASDKLHERAGVEYSVLLASGEERQLVQDIQSGESILQRGEECRLQISGTLNRVLPASHYPDEVKRPRKIKFSD